MAFMQLQFTNEPFLTGENHYSEGYASPLSAWISTSARNDPDAQIKAMDAYAKDHNLVRSSIEIVHDKWWCRLSAPGYMDCTDWDGPHDDEQAARTATQRNYDVNPDTGDNDDEEEEE